MRQISFKRHRFPPDVIRYAVWLYYRFTMSLRDVEDLLAERGIETLDDLADLAVDDLMEIEGMDEERAARLIMQAREPMFANAPEE